MKVGSVSSPLYFRSQTRDNTPYLYTANEEYKPKFSFKEHKAEYFAGFLALVAASYSLAKFMARNTTPKNVVELANKKLGLNKIKNHDVTVSVLKEKILYPIMSVKNGERRLLQSNFRTGLIIGNENEAELGNLFNAFMEHAKELGITCQDVKYPKKTNKIREVNKAIDAAITHHRKTGECVIVNIGDLGAITNLKVAKTQIASNLEKRLAHMPKGVLWAAWTNKPQKLPYFYNNLPTLFVKLTD